MKANATSKNDLTDELVNIKTIIEAEQTKERALADARRQIMEKLTESSMEAERVKEKVINDARSERKKMIQQAIEQAKLDAKAVVGKQIQDSDELRKQGEKWINDVAKFAVNFILGLNQENE